MFFYHHYLSGSSRLSLSKITYQYFINRLEVLILVLVFTTYLL